MRKVFEDEVKNARSRVLKLLGYRFRSSYEIESYLQRKAFSAETISRVMAEMRQVGYIDDIRFADEYMALCVRRGYGPRRAWSRLREKGVDRRIIESRIDSHFDPDTDLRRAKEILEKRTGPGDDTSDSRWIRRQAAFLKQRGFNDGLILNLLKSYQAPGED